MMRSHASSDYRVPMTMAANLRMLLDGIAHEIAPQLATFVSCVATHRSRFRRCLIATPPRRHEDDRG